MTRITNKTILLFFLLLHDLPPYLKASFEKVSTSASYQVVLPSLLLLWSWCIVSPPSYSCVTYRLQILPRLLSFWTSSLYVCILLRLFSHGPRAPLISKLGKHTDTLMAHVVLVLDTWCFHDPPLALLALYAMFLHSCYYSSLDFAACFFRHSSMFQMTCRAASLPLAHDVELLLLWYCFSHITLFRLMSYFDHRPGIPILEIE